MMITRWGMCLVFCAMSVFSGCKSADGIEIFLSEHNRGYGLLVAPYEAEVTGAAIGTNSFGYAFDLIGNRLASTANGAETSYAANALNQYTGISTPNSFDADGNLLSDGAFAYAWDAENRLVSAVPIIPAHGSKRIQNRYDWRKRLVQMDTQIYQGGAWHPHETRTLVYDGWLPILELTSRTDGTSSTTEYFWGADLSGTEQGAGGVGGLLAVSVDGQYHLPCYDHNGNVTAYVSENGTPSAQYLYDAFGNTLEQSGPMADAFRFRFSTKYFMPETRSYYYGYRFYLPETGRWLNRDPIGEDGGLNLYGFVGNDPLSYHDQLGLIMKKCGTLVERALEQSANWWEEITSMILAPHMFIITDDGERLDHFGSGQGEDHWSATQSPISILYCADCEKFSSCLKDEYRMCVNRNSEWSLLNHCQTIAKRAIRTCKAKPEFHSARLVITSIFKRCCDEK